MELVTIACNNCGAPLKVPNTANFVTCNHCGSQLAVKRNENVTYTEKIKEIDERTEQMQKELEGLRIDNELAAMERRWEREKEGFMVKDKDGHKHLPTTTGSVVGGIVIVVFGVIWTVFAAGIGGAAGGFSGFDGGFSPFSCFPLFGVAFVIFGLIMSCYSYSKAKDYLRAERDYRRRRSALLDKKYAARGDHADKGDRADEKDRDIRVNIRP